ncbi:nucleobase-ascorbate transporter 12 [Actinidia rufa]|uniref:Nucleobase-ascorbate transporter 12 n=1 Tax=Actinidia rufa TaxID=165716 RepID=A0A7J0G938_9ERIC|nr:nucleobase-ascorbate transporter 12 [Actinidia rufa]
MPVISDQIVVRTKPREPDSQVDIETGRALPAAAVNGELECRKGAAGNTRGGEGASVPPPPPSRRPVRREEVVDVLPQTVDDEGFLSRRSHMKYELRDTPGLVPIGLYGFQHYISMLGSLVLVPLVIVPAMGGSNEDTANVVSTVLFVSGVTTLLHTSFGSRLPLIQGPSFVYLAPALTIINSPEFLGLNGNNFKHIMKELQGAIIISSAFQAILGLINPVVVAPTIAAVGLSFYSYGFPRVGTCLEIGAVQILLVIIFSLVPLGLAITWAAAFLLTEAGAYSYKGCDVNVPVSNIISEHCRKHISRMKQCRADTSQALKSSPWFRFPYPLQWGTPVFNWKMDLFMCVVSLISSVDSWSAVVCYNPNATSVRRRSKHLNISSWSPFPCKPGALEGKGRDDCPKCICLKVGSYHASSLLVVSRPPTPGVLSRGIGLEGLSGILAGLWGTGTGSTTLTENVHTIAVTKMGSRRAVELGACFLIVLSLVVVLDNTVPGSSQERGVYIWSEPEAARRDPAVAKDYGLPFRVGRVFRWVKWVGL